MWLRKIHAEEVLRKATMIRAFFIDPFKMQLSDIDLPNDVALWHKLLMCDSLDAYHFRMNSGVKLPLSCWVDGDGLLRDKPWPCFTLGPSGDLCGYGLITYQDRRGETINIPDFIQIHRFVLDAPLLFEAWESRLNPDDYIEQLTRAIELELPDKVRSRKLITGQRED
jgi:hypothetical protein